MILMDGLVECLVAESLCQHIYLIANFGIDGEFGCRDDDYSIESFHKHLLHDG
jgi:Uri superfamily endonuclease